MTSIFDRDSPRGPTRSVGEFFQTARFSSLLKRFAAPEEVALLIASLCRPPASATNGAALRVDGGVVRSLF